MSSKPLRVFVPHGSTLLTDHAPHGDGLVQWGFLRELATRGHRIVVTSPAVSISGAIPETLEIVELAGARNLLDYTLRSRRIYALKRREEPFDIIHQMNPVVRGVSLAWATDSTPVILGTYVGDWPHDTPIAKMLGASAFIRASMVARIIADVVQQRFASRLLLTTPFARNRVPLRIGLEGRIEYVQHGIDVSLFSPVARPDDPISHPQRVVFVGALAAHKGLDVLLESFDSIARAFPRATLTLVGRGPLEAMAQERATAGGWSRRLELVGAVEPVRVAGWLRASTVLCAPSRGEAYGQNVLEAMACGLPVIATAAGGVQFLVPRGGGFVVQPESSEALAEALTAIFRDPEQARGFGLRNRSVILEKYAWPHVVDHLENVYRATLRAKNRSGGRTSSKRDRA